MYIIRRISISRCSSSLSTSAELSWNVTAANGSKMTNLSMKLSLMKIKPTRLECMMRREWWGIRTLWSLINKKKMHSLMHKARDMESWQTIMPMEQKNMNANLMKTMKMVMWLDTMTTVSQLLPSNMKEGSSLDPQNTLTRKGNWLDRSSTYKKNNMKKWKKKL